MTKKSGNVVVITGASAGVGRATAREFAREGARLGLIARDRSRLEAAQSEVRSLGGDALVLTADVADSEQIERAAARVEDEFGPIDIWVNCAMATIMAPFDELTAEEFKRVTDVTYHGNVNGTMAALKRMLARDHGTIVQVSSALAFHSVPLQAPYCGAKHAINGYTQSLQTELLHRGSHVHVAIVDMPGLNTPQFDWARNKMSERARPVAPVYQPEVAARAIVWTAHHRRRQVYVGLSSQLMIWADKFAPGLLDRYMARTTISGQQTNEPEDPNRPDNLWHTVEGAFGARGRFSREAYADSIQFWATTHRPQVALAAGALLVTLLGAATAESYRRKQQRRVSGIRRILPSRRRLRDWL